MMSSEELAQQFEKLAQRIRSGEWEQFGLEVRCGVKETGTDPSGFQTRERDGTLLLSVQLGKEFPAALRELMSQL